MSNVASAIRSGVLLLAVVAPLSGHCEEQAQPDSLIHRSLYADRRAYDPGDILTVIITETAAATATARTSADKSDNVTGAIQQPDEDPWRIQFAFSNDFTGGGQIQRTGRLVARLAVLVEGVDPNGNLLIRGEQDIEVNNEKQRIALTGLIRPEDITPDNTVASWRIANADIDFVGKGILARKQSPSLITKLFDLFGLN